MSFWSTVPWKRLVWAIWLPIYLTLFFIMEAVFPGTGDNYWITSFPFEENIQNDVGVNHQSHICLTSHL